MKFQYELKSVIEMKEDIDKHLNKIKEHEL
jgi:hypothetical protein